MSFEGKLGQWSKLMREAREAGAKYVDPAENPFLHDEDLPELVKREREDHDRRQRVEEMKARAKRQADDRKRERDEAKARRKEAK
jgi:hypothetical protein